MILLIDNYDSFTYNLVQMLEEMKQVVEVFRNNQISLEGIKTKKPDAIVISPGPCTPAEAGISVDTIRFFFPWIPILGICLGHQSIAAAFHGKVIRADRIMHGKTSLIYHDGDSIYRNLPNPFEAIRYHSLIVERDSLPQCLKISAWTEDGEIMGLRHVERKAEGVQFHPESILTREGPSMMKNWLGGL